MRRILILLIPLLQVGDVWTQVRVFCWPLRVNCKLHSNTSSFQLQVLRKWLWGILNCTLKIFRGAWVRRGAERLRKDLERRPLNRLLEVSGVPNGLPRLLELRRTIGRERMTVKSRVQYVVWHHSFCFALQMYGTVEPANVFCYDQDLLFENICSFAYYSRCRSATRLWREKEGDPKIKMGITAKERG